MTTHLPTKNMSFSKDGCTFTCPGCEKQETYQIGKFESDKWVKHRGKWWCVDCVSKWHPVYIPTFSPAYQVAVERVEEEKKQSDLDKLMDMI